MSGGGISRMAVTNTVCTNANTEYSRALPAFCNYFLIKSRTDTAEIKFTFAAGESGTAYITVPIGSFYWQYAQLVGTKTIYFQSPEAGAIVEIIASVS